MAAQISDPAGSLELLHHKLDRMERTIDNMNGNVAKLAKASPPSTDGAAAGPAAAQLQEDVSRLQQELNDKVEEIKVAEQRLASAQQGFLKWQGAAAGLENDLAAARAELTELETHAATAREQLAGLEARRHDAERVLAEAAAAGEQIAKAEQSRAEAEQALTKLREREQEYAGYQQAHENAQRLVTRIWPAWMLNAEFAAWRSQIESGIFAADPPASLSLLFAALHSYRAALREAGDSRVLLDSLRELSRRLLTWLKELGQGEAEAATASQQWAAAINRECDGKAEVEVPMPGNPADAAWMIFPTRTGASDVLSVQSWCVRDGQKRPINKAQVTV